MLFFNKRSFVVGFIILSFFLLFTSCPGNNDDDDSANNPATIHFVNYTTFKVDIYKNLNPENFDPTKLVCSINDGNTYIARMNASLDQVIGDVFYIRYKVLLANSFDTGTTSIYVDAQRDLSNISLVVESGKTYTKQIPQPTVGQLKFINGYVKVQNMSSAQVQIQRANTILLKLDNNSAYLSAGSDIGFYEITLNYLDDVLNMSQLKAFSSSYLDFPSFNIERGKLYSFIIYNSVITGPNITNLDSLR